MLRIVKRSGRHFVVVCSPNMSRKLKQLGIGESKNGVVELDVLELAYLLWSRKAVATQNDRLLEWLDLLANHDDVATELIVYIDLLKRHCRVTVLSEKSKLVRFLVSKSGERFMVIPLREGSSIESQELISHVREASLNACKLLLALVDSRGSVVYYEAERFDANSVKHSQAREL